ncbi:unnamed protein product, partial [Schistosoma guineensis]
MICSLTDCFTNMISSFMSYMNSTINYCESIISNLDERSYTISTMSCLNLFYFLFSKKKENIKIKMY